MKSSLKSCLLKDDMKCETPMMLAKTISMMICSGLITLNCMKTLRIQQHLSPTTAVSFHLKRDLVWETKAVAEAFTFFSSTSMILSFSIIKRKWVISVVIIPCVVTFMLFFCIHSYTFSRHFDGYYDLIHFRGEAPTSFVKACLKRYPHV